MFVSLTFSHQVYMYNNIQDGPVAKIVRIPLNAQILAPPEWNGEICCWSNVGQDLYDFPTMYSHK